MELSPTNLSRLLVDSYPTERGFTRAWLRVKPYVYPFHEVVQFVPPGGAVLDVGCGIGMMTVVLAKLGKARRAQGFDVSDRAIAIARKALIPPGCEIAFDRITTDRDWPDASFDVAVCIDVLHHVPKSEQRAFVRSLTRPGRAQRIILKEVSPRPFWMGMANVVSDLLINRELVHLVDENDLASWLKEDGFEIVENKRIHALVFSHYLIVADRVR